MFLVLVEEIPRLGFTRRERAFGVYVEGHEAQRFHRRLLRDLEAVVRSPAEGEVRLEHAEFRNELRTFGV